MANVVEATSEDLRQILSWLHDEYKRDGYGFWLNRSKIRRRFDEGEFHVIRVGGEAIAFKAGLLDFVSVREDHRRTGFGTLLAKAAVEHAILCDINILNGECYPESSLPFWKKQGFAHLGSGAFGSQLIRLVIARHFELPPDAAHVAVNILFFPEQALYDPAVLPLMDHQVLGTPTDEGSITLSRRIVGFSDDYSHTRDLVVKIAVDEKELLTCKAKAAGHAGVHRDRAGAFYIDSLTL